MGGEFWQAEVRGLKGSPGLAPKGHRSAVQGGCHRVGHSQGDLPKDWGVFDLIPVFLVGFKPDTART